MRNRCNNKNEKSYKWYGGRGIKICDDWNDYGIFFEWAMKNNYKEGLSIERIDVNGNYCPENCKWITMEEQHKNTTRTRIIEYDGKKMSLSDWARYKKIDKVTLYNRLERGWSIDKALNTPARKSNRSTRERKLATPPRTSPASSD